MGITLYQCFPQDLGQGVHNLNSNQLWVMLTNTAPNVATDAKYSDISAGEVANGNGYSTGGAQITGNSWTQTGGVAKLQGTSVVICAASGSVGPYRYVVLYNKTATNKNLIGYWDKGYSVSLASGQSETLSIDNTTGLLTIP